MKDNAPAANESSGMDVEQLMNELESVKAELSSVKDELDRVKQDFAGYRDAVSKKFSGHEDELEELEARFEEDNPYPSDDEDASTDGDLLPIERISRLKQKNEQHPAIPTNGRESLDRAMSIYENFDSWSEKAPKGRIIKSGIKRLLETATGESLYWSQIHRAMDMIEKWTDGVISHEQHDRFGHILIADEQALLAATG